jgi:hypothetical protein
MKNIRYHTVGTVPKSNRKIKDTTLLEQIQNPIEKIVEAILFYVLCDKNLRLSKVWQ